MGQREGLSVGDPLTYLREYEHVTLARALLEEFRTTRAQTVLDDADGLLARLLEAGTAGGRRTTSIEIMVLQARSRQLRGDDAGALEALDRALLLAEPERHVRIFVDEGQPMAELLTAVAATDSATRAYVHLLSSLGQAPLGPGRASRAPWWIRSASASKRCFDCWRPT